MTKTDSKGRKIFYAHEVCEMLNVSKKTLFSWEENGIITRIDRDWRQWRTYREEDIKKIKTVIENKATNSNRKEK